MTQPIPDAVLAHHIAILGKTGSGKTATEKLSIEQVVADGFRVCILDPIKSDWWGITSSADGQRPGLPFKILGGPHGHVPLHSSAGKAIGQLVGSGSLPLSIIDMADFEPGGLQRFFVDFAPALMSHMRGVLYLVIEEAHEFAPKERAGIGAENLAIHWAKRLATAGRSKGVRLIVATQRVQSLHNAVLGSCETVIAHRLTTPADQEPVLKWLKANTDKATLEQVAASLSSLPTGTGWLCSGEAGIFQQVAFPKFKTYDNTATPTGDSDDVVVRTAPVDQDELRAIIGDAVKQAEANDPKLLKAEIVRLTAEIAKARQNPSGFDEQALRVAESAGFMRGVEEGEKRGHVAGQAVMLTRAQTALNNLRVDGAPEKSPETPVATLPARYDWRAARDGPRPAPAPARPEILPSDDAPTLAKGERRVLDALGWWAAFGRDQPGLEQIAFVAGYSPGSGNFGNIRGALRSKGLVEYSGPGMTSLTNVGRALATIPNAPPTGEALRLRVLEKLKPPARRLLEPLIEAWPNGLTGAELAEKAGYAPTSGNFGNLRGSLRTLGCIDYPAPGMSCASDWMFP